MRLGDLPHLLAVGRFQLRQRDGMTLLDPVPFCLVPAFVLLRDAGGFFGNDRRLFAALIADAADGLPPFLIDRPLGFLEFSLDSFLLRLQMRGGFFQANIEQPPRLGEIAGDSRRQWCRRATADKIKHHDQHQGRERRAGFDIGNQVLAKMRQQRIGHGHGQQAGNEQPERQKFENFRQRQFAKALQVAGNFCVSFLQFGKERVFVRGQIRLRPGPVVSQPPLKAEIAAERAARRCGELIPFVTGIAQMLLKNFKRRGGVGQRLVAADLRRLHAQLRAFFPLRVLLADFVQHAAADGGVGGVDPGLAPLKMQLALVLFIFQRHGRVHFDGHGGRFLRLILAGKIPQFGGGLDAEIALQFFLARGEIADVFFQRVQQRERFVDAGQAIHSRSSLFSTVPPACPKWSRCDSRWPKVPP